MSDFARGVVAVAGLGAREAMRNRVWTLAVAAALLVAAMGARLDAVDAQSRQKLAVALVTGGAAFVANLLAILLVAHGVRRDLDGRVALLLFAKPLPRAAYLVGRWLGALIVVAGALAVVIGAGIGVCAWRSGLPTCSTVVAPDEWRRLNAAGAEEAPPAGRTQLVLSGPSGNAVRARFAGLPPPPGDSYSLLLRAAVLGTDASPTVDCRVHVAAVTPAGDVPLAVDPASPYGRVADAPPGEAVLTSRDESRAQLDADYLRVRLPASAVVDGAAVVRVTRLDRLPTLRFARADAILIAAPAGGFALNLGRAGLAMLAVAAPLAAWTLVCACVSNLAVALLGGLTLLFTGEALPAIAESLAGDAAAPARRLIALVAWLVPDAERLRLGARLAATRAVEWSAVGDAWAYHGAYALAFLIVAWWALRAREVA